MKKQTKLLGLLMSLALLLTILPSTVRAEDSQEVFVTNCAVPEDDGCTEAELLEGYFFSVGGLYEDNTALFRAPRPALPGELPSVYNELKPMIQQVADGARASTTFEISSTWTKTKSEWGISGEAINAGALTEEASTAIEAAFNLDALTQRMLSEMPYELYWFDKTGGIRMSYGVSLSGENLTVKNLTISMHISQSYAKINEGGATYDPLTADTAKTSAAKCSAENAALVVVANAAKSDYEKLRAYLDYIKEAVSYDNEAADNGATPYGDPWQIIHVFDNDPTTNVVCEGYAKAFKYLCDLSSFNESDLFCSLVTGTTSGGNGAGSHMWDIVSIGGKNYLADVTNCDTGTVGAPDKLFLCGAIENVDGRKYTATAGGQSIVYEYDTDTLSDYAAADLKLEEMPYHPNDATGLTVSGTVKSYGSTSDTVTVTLLDSSANQVGTPQILTGAAGTAPYTQNYYFSAVPAGTYTLKVEKKGHAPWTETITVGSTEIVKDVTIYLWGDVNRDGAVTAADAQEIQRKAAGLSSVIGTDLNPAYCTLRADVNQDGAITAADAQEIQRKAAGLSSTISNLP